MTALSPDGVGKASRSSRAIELECAGVRADAVAWACFVCFFVPFLLPFLCRCQPQKAEGRRVVHILQPTASPGRNPPSPESARTAPIGPACPQTPTRPAPDDPRPARRPAPPAISMAEARVASNTMPRSATWHALASLIRGCSSSENKTSPAFTGEGGQK